LLWQLLEEAPKKANKYEEKLSSLTNETLPQHLFSWQTMPCGDQEKAWERGVGDFVCWIFSDQG